MRSLYLKTKQLAVLTEQLLISVQALIVLNQFCLLHARTQLNKERSELAVNRRGKVRETFSSFVASISPAHFRRMFRMPCECFHQLCEKIKRNVGEREFCSEDYIKEHLKHGTSKEARMYQAHEKTSGGWLCGEARVALALRMLAGASYLDLAIIFNVAYGLVFSMM